MCFRTVSVVRDQRLRNSQIQGSKGTPECNVIRGPGLDLALEGKCTVKNTLG